MSSQELFGENGFHANQPPWLINYISQDPVQIGKVRAYRKIPINIRLMVTQKPCIEKTIDVFILPADMIPALPEAVKWQYPMPVLAYGHPLLLKKAFDAGAYDFLKEPWAADEFWARSSRLIERWKKSTHWGNFELKGNRLCETSQGRRKMGTGVQPTAREIPLSCQEASVLKALLKNRGEAMSRQMLFYALWGKQPRGRSRVVDMHISSLRRKIRSCRGPDGIPLQISTSRGVGYLIPE